MRGRPGLELGHFPDGRPARLDLTAAPGIGVQGEGAADFLRGLIAHVLVDQPDYPAGTIVIADRDADALELLDGPLKLPDGIWGPGTLALVLAAAEKEIDSRERMPPRYDWPLMVLALTEAPTDPAQNRRLAELADRGRAYGVAAVILGPWPGGDTLAIGPDGTVTVARGPATTPVYGARMYALHPERAHQILAAMTHIEYAESDDPPTERPAPPDHYEHDDEYNAEPEHRPDRPAEGAEAAERISEPTGGTTDPDGGSPAAVVRHGPARAASDLTRLACAPGMYRLEILRRVRLLYTPPTTAENDQPEPQLIPLADGKAAVQAFTMLGLHPDGMRKDRLTGLLWPGSTNPGRAFNTTTYRVREAANAQLGATLPDPIHATTKHVQLDRTLITVDYWDLLHTLTLNDTDQLDQKTCAYELATTSYEGEAAPEIDADWIEPYRQEIRDKTITAAHQISQALAERGDTDRAIEILEHATHIDEYNEETFNRIIEIQRSTGNDTAADRTYRRLSQKLGELGAEPSSDAS